MSHLLKSIILSTVLSTTTLAEAQVAKCKTNLQYTLSQWAVDSIENSMRLYTREYFDQLRKHTMKEADQRVSQIIKEHPQWIAFSDLMAKIIGAWLENKLTEVTYGNTSIWDRELATLFCEVSDFFCVKNDNWKFEFLPLTWEETIDIDLFKKYPEIYDAWKRTKPGITDIMLCNTHIHYFDNSKNKNSQWASWTWNHLFIADNLTGDDKNEVILNELTGEYFDQCFGDRSMWLNKEHIYHFEWSNRYYFVDKNLNFSNKNTWWGKIISSKINELRWDLYSLKHYPHTKTIEHVMTKWFEIATLDIFRWDKQTIKQNQIIKRFNEEYWNDGYILVWAFIAKHLKEIYKIYGLEKTYNEYVEQTLQYRQTTLTMPNAYTPYFDLLKKAINKNPKLLSQRASDKFACLNNNLLELQK